MAYGEKARIISMQVFGFMSLHEELVTQGAKLLSCSPRVPLWASGWGEPYKDFIPELGWDSSEELWIIQAQREAILARMEAVCQLDAMHLLVAGRRLGAVGHDTRLRRAMISLGLSQSQLAVPINCKDNPEHRMRWLEVLDYLLGTHRSPSKQALFTQLCLIENTTSWHRFERWREKTWMLGPGQMILGNKEKPWQVDISSGDAKTRVLAFSGKQHILVEIRGEGLSDLQDPDPRHISVYVMMSLDEMLERIELLFSRPEESLEVIKSVRLADLYEGGPIASHLLGLKSPRLRIHLGEMIGWQQMLRTRWVKSDHGLIDPQPLDWPGGAFAEQRNVLHPMLEDEQDQLAMIKYACYHIMPGGLFRPDLPGVSGRAATLPTRLVLYRPVNPFASASLNR